jgi:hypothetical protein
MSSISKNEILPFPSNVILNDEENDVAITILANGRGDPEHKHHILRSD